MSFFFELHTALRKSQAYITLSVLTSLNTNDRSSESQWDGEALPDVDHSVKQAILCIWICNHTLLLLQGLKANTNNMTRMHNTFLIINEGGVGQ